MNQDQVITLNVTVAEANGILQALGNMPFNQVFPLISKVKEQADNQVNAAPTDVFVKE